MENINSLKSFLFSFILILGALHSKAEKYSIELVGISVAQTDQEILIKGVDKSVERKFFLMGTDTVWANCESGSCTAMVPISANTTEITLSADNQTFSSKVNPAPLWLAIIPPLLAIGLAFGLREVNTALFSGVVVGSVIIAWYTYESGAVFWGVLDSIGIYVLESVSDPGHMSIVIFSLLIGALVAIITENGSMQDLVRRLIKDVKNRHTVQLYTWLMGVLIFFDDYANTLVVGNTMRPLTDRMKISREKLAYIVDSTAAPIASVAFITTWIGAEVGYIEDSISSIPQLTETTNAYALFLGSIPYSFYPIFTLGFIFMLILMRRDFGPMYSAEKRALSEDVSDEIKQEEKKGQWYLAVIPILILIGGAFAFLIITGYSSNIWNSDSLGVIDKLSQTIGQSDAYAALLWSSFLAVLSAVLLNVLVGREKLGDTMETFSEGIKSMLPAIIILTLAWSIATITQELHTADFLLQLLGDNVAIWLIPALTFALSAIVAFATGSSWGTMAILYPIIVPTLYSLGLDQGLSINDIFPLLLNAISTVLAGAVLGDHCSPLSDTTILSSLATKCNHIKHVNTQMPYALVVGVTSLAVGTLPVALGFPLYAAYPIGFGVLFLIIRYHGKKVEANEPFTD